MIKIGLIGLGHLGKIHLKLLKQIKNIDLVGIYDLDSELTKKLAKEYDVQAYLDVNQLIKNCHALDVVTPTITHHEYAKNIIKQGKHVFIEKPLANTLKEGKELVDLAREANSKVQVGHVERFNAGFLAAKDYIDSPMFIESHRLAIFNPRGTDVSVVLDLMIHDIDIILTAVKSNIKKIHASGVSVVSDTPDICNARIEFDNGAVANLTSSRISMKNMRKMRFFQSNAYVSVDFLEKNAEILSLKDLPSDFSPDTFDLVIPVNQGTSYKKIDMHLPDITPNNAIQAELEEFVQAIINDNAPPVTIDQAYKAMEVAHWIQEKISH